MTEVKTRPVPATTVDDITKARDIPGAFKFFTSDGIGPGMTCVPVRLSRARTAPFPARAKSVLAMGRQSREADAAPQRPPYQPLARLAAERCLGELLTGRRGAGAQVPLPAPPTEPLRGSAGLKRRMRGYGREFPD